MLECMQLVLGVTHSRATHPASPALDELRSAFIIHLALCRSPARRLQAVEYGRVIVGFTVLRHLNWVLESTKPAVLAEQEAKASINSQPFPLRKAGQSSYNT